jgi:hypothetical protein
MSESDKHLFEAWCTQHDCHPSECFYIHNPKAKTSGRSLTAEEQAAATAKKHLVRQQINELRNRKGSSNGTGD